jgi:hypothetical protein
MDKELRMLVYKGQEICKFLPCYKLEIALSGGIVLEEAVDLSYDRLLMNEMQFGMTY